MKILLFIVAILFSNIVSAETYVQVNGISLHDRSGYNSWNWGAGLEQGITDRWTVVAGWYRNSEYSGSFYTYGRYSVYKKSDWDFGIGVGAVTGYRRAAVIPMAFPEVCYAWLCAVAFPRVEAAGANVLGLRARIPIN